MNRFFKWFGLPGSLVLTVLISILAVMLAVFMPTSTRVICVFAMLLSSLGDILLMNFKPITDLFPKKFRGFYAGATVFAASHIVYFSAFLTHIIQERQKYFNIGAINGIAVFVGISLWLIIACFRRNGDKKILPLCILYIFFISLNLTTVFSVAASNGGIFMLSAVGIISFLISDIIIVIDKVLGVELKNSDVIIWTLYPLGQILLLVGA